jgi:hypothetical protein
MGFTHYWRFKTPLLEKIDKGITDETFSNISSECKRLCKNLPKHSESAGGYYKEYPIIIKGLDGTGEPTFDEKEISFNGDDATEMSHESFMITADDLKEFDFCKTARKPYDLLVCACLLSFYTHFPKEVFSVSSDGDSSDWEPAVEFYNSTLNANVKNPIVD